MKGCSHEPKRLSPDHPSYMWAGFFIGMGLATG